MDLIDRQAAIEYLMTNMTWYSEEGYEETDDEKRNAITSLISGVPSAQQWIPCSERLPDITDHHTSEPCIVYCDNGAYGFAELEENFFGQVGWNCERDDDYHEALGTVIAWMPLPEPWKGSEE